MSKKFVIGDIHGRSIEFKMLLEKINFNFEEDELISLGDIWDRGPDPLGVIDTLDKIKNCIWIMGNHDETTIDWLSNLVFYDRFYPYCWGDTEFGAATQEIIKNLSKFERQELYLKIKNKIKIYHIDKDNNLFVHAGVSTSCEIEKTPQEHLIWDRSFIKNVIHRKLSKKDIEYIEKYNHIYVGHTPTFTFSNKNGKWFENKGTPEIFTPITYKNVTNMDTGGGFSFGFLSIKDLDTQEIFQQKIITK